MPDFLIKVPGMHLNDRVLLASIFVLQVTTIALLVLR
jgi:hypothetical protein